MEKLPVEKSKIKEKESKEKEPNISYEFFYASHRTPKDLEKLEKVFGKADVYIPEASSWTQEVLKSANDLSQGKITAKDVASIYRFSTNSSRFKELQLIEGSKKPILFVDIPFGHELIKADERAGELKAKGESLFKQGDFQTSIQITRKGIEASAGNLLKREEIIEKNIEGEMKKLIANSPELKAKKEVNALIKLGGAHTRIYHRFKQKDQITKRHFSQMPFIYTSRTEAYRQIVLSKNKKLSDELLAKVIIENCVLDYVFSLTDDTNKAFRISRKISSRLDLKDIEEISQKLGENSQKTIADCLRERDIEVPTTEEEMDEILKIKKAKI